MKKPSIFSNAARELMQAPIQRTRDVFSIIGSIKDLVSFIGSGFALVFTISSASGLGDGSRWAPIFDLFPVRALVFVMMSAAMGWTFAALISWFSMRQSELELLFGAVFGIIWAAILIGLAMGIFFKGKSANTPIFLIFCVMGLIISLTLSMSKLRTLRTGDVRYLRYQSGVTAIYAASAAVIALVSPFAS